MRLEWFVVAVVVSRENATWFSGTMSLSCSLRIFLHTVKTGFAGRTVLKSIRSAPASGAIVPAKMA